MLTRRRVDEDDIDDQCTALRNKLQDERKAGKSTGRNARSLKSHQVHDLAKAKIEESERLRKALGISEDYEEGSHWRKQEERLRESLAQREKDEELLREKGKEARRYRDAGEDEEEDR